MILKIKPIKTCLKSLTPLNLLYGFAVYAALVFPHQVTAGVYLAYKTWIEIMMFGLGAFFISLRPFGRWKSIKESGFLSVWAMAALVVAAAVFAQNRPLALEAVMLFFAYLICFYVFVTLPQSWISTNMLVRFILLVSLFICSYGWYRFFIVNSGFETGTCFKGTFGNRNQLAGWLSMVIPLCVGEAMACGRKNKLVWFFNALLIFMILTQIFNLARGGWTSTLCGTAFMAAAQISSEKFSIRRCIAFILFVFILLGFVVISVTPVAERAATIHAGEEDASFSARILVWKGTIDLIRAHPLIGVGPGNYSNGISGFQPPGIGNLRFHRAHNEYLHFISETGLLLLPIMIWMAVTLFAKGFNKLKLYPKPDKMRILGMMGGIFSMLVYSLSDVNLHIPANVLLFTVLAAVTAAPLNRQPANS